MTALAAGAAVATPGIDLEKGNGEGTAFEPEFELKPARNPPPTSAYEIIPLLIMFKPFVQPFVRLVRRSDKTGEKTNLLGRKRKVALAEGNVPLEITLFLHSYYSHVLKQPGWLVPATASGFLASLNALQDAVANLERVRNSEPNASLESNLPC